jgi:hypothetical protein
VTEPMNEAERAKERRRIEAHEAIERARDLLHEDPPDEREATA